MAELGSLVPLMLCQQLVKNKRVGGHPGHHLAPITPPQHTLTTREAADQGSLGQLPADTANVCGASTTSMCIVAGRKTQAEGLQQVGCRCTAKKRQGLVLSL